MGIIKNGDYIYRLFNVGDYVICRDLNIRGTVLRFYVATGDLEEQTMIETDDGRLFHGPTSTFLPYEKEPVRPQRTMIRTGRMCGKRTILKETERLLNKHGEYVLAYARNHGISVNEAFEAPMVKAHQRYCDVYGTAHNDILDSLTYTYNLLDNGA